MPTSQMRITPMLNTMGCMLPKSQPDAMPDVYTNWFANYSMRFAGSNNHRNTSFGNMWAA